MNTVPELQGMRAAESRRVLRSFLGILICVVLVGCHGKSSSPPQGGGPAAGNATPAISALSSTSTPVAGPGFSLVVTGSGFVSGSVVRWNGSDLVTTFGSATQLTATVPAANLTFAGIQQVSVASPAPGGGSSANTAFTVVAQIANGTSLGGAAASLAINATTDVLPVGVASSHVKNNVIMNRLDVRFARGATVGQVNDALASIGAGIVSMSQGFVSVTVGIPEQPSLAALKGLIAHLEAQPGVSIVTVAAVAAPQAIFPRTSVESAASLIRHLLPSRFPAAWNVAPTTQFGDPRTPNPQQRCPNLAVRPVLVADFFKTPLSLDLAQAFQQLTAPDDADPGFDSDDLEHGGFVILTLGGNGIGANPFAFSGCVDVRLVQMGKFYTWRETIDLIVSRMPAGRFVANLSAGFPQSCVATPCSSGIDVFNETTALFIADKTLYWKEKTRGRWQDFLWVNAAGNDRDEESSSIYPGFADSRFESPMTAARIPDPLFQWALEDDLWRPSDAFHALGFTTLEPTALEMNDLDLDVVTAHMDDAGAAADNVITVGSVVGEDPGTETSVYVPLELMHESDFSDRNADVLAVGETVFGINGTSFAAPQIAGLINFLWMISDDLSERQPVTITKRAILANARNGIVDAYATVLSLDDPAAFAAGAAPIRLTLLDANRDVKFDEADVDEFLRHYYLVNTNGAPTNEPVVADSADFSRYDLNGDGFTGGDGREHFDLDPSTSTRYGASLYTPVSQNIEGDQILFNEAALTDVEILCYYAYSALYTGADPVARRDLLKGRCGIVVQPSTATIDVGGQQQFTALTPSNGTVNWSATCGSVDANGFYTAGSSPGQCTVRATDANNPTLSGTAVVTVNGPPGSPVTSVSVVTRASAPTEISAEVQRQDGSDVFIRKPIGDPGAFAAALESELANATATAIPNVQMDFQLPVSLTLNLASHAVTVLIVSDCTLGSAGGAVVDVTVGDAQNIQPSSCGGTISVHGTTTRNATVNATVGGRVNLGLSGGVTRDLFVGACDHGTLSVNVPTVQRHLDIVSNMNCAVTVAATPLQFLEIEDNVNSTIGTVHGGDINELTVSGNSGSTFSVAVGDVKDVPTNSALVTISNNSGVSLSSLDFGDDEGPLTITNNTGFTDQQAQDFATNQRTVGGTVTVSGNH